MFLDIENGESHEKMPLQKYFQVIADILTLFFVHDKVKYRKTHITLYTVRLIPQAAVG
jgi:hypothetical protein